MRVPHKKDKEKSFFSFENLESNKNGILKLLFGINLITMIIAIYIWTSINKMKIQLGVEKINEEEFNKKLLVINLVNELSVIYPSRSASKLLFFFYIYYFIHIISIPLA